MKLKEFTPKNCISNRGKCNVGTMVASMSINFRTGLSRLNISAVHLIGLSAGDQVKFHQDEDEPDQWYLEKVTSGGFLLREKKSISPGLIFNNIALSRMIAESVAFTGKSGKCLIAGEPTEHEGKIFWGILTSTLRNK